MSSDLQFKIRGITYQFACLNPFRPTILAGELPLGIKLEAYKRDGVGRGLYRSRIHEPGLTRFLLSTFGNGQPHNFIDVGANIGYFSCLFSKLAGPSGKVLAFEPEPQNFRLLERNLHANLASNVELHRCALGSHQGAAALGLYKPGNRGRHSMVDPNVKSTISVPLRKLDDVVAESGYANFPWSLVKIDVEGYEPVVLQGAENVLAHTRMLVLEYTPHLWKRTGIDPADVFKKLSSCFSIVSQIRNEGLRETSFEDCARSDAQTDLLFQHV